LKLLGDRQRDEEEGIMAWIFWNESWSVWSSNLLNWYDFSNSTLKNNIN
jgi:hypothetical protein